MTNATGSTFDLASCDLARRPRSVSAQTVCGLAALGFSLSLGGWILYTRPVQQTQPPVSIRLPLPEAHAAAPAPVAPVQRYVALFDGGVFVGGAPGPFAQTTPLAPAFQANPMAEPVESVAVAVAPDPVAPAAPPVVVAAAEAVLPASPPLPPVVQLDRNVPLPAPRPPELRFPVVQQAPVRGAGRLALQHRRTSVAAVTPPDNRNFFQKIFGMPAQPPGPMLAYAAPEDNFFGGSRSLTSGPSVPHDRYTAVYDISAHTVYMPDGTRLEAHSGLGDKLDDPRHVAARNRGPTPPNIYELTPREQLFHGVRALRLNPVGNASVFGRNGLLAHTYMLGPNGDFNGCVSFRNYDQFLQSYLNGQVKRLEVVARMN